MENTNPDNVIRRCQNPACGKEFVMRRPSRPGKYGVNCPHCNAVNYFSLAEEGPSEVTLPLPPTQNTDLRENQPQENAHPAHAVDNKPSATESRTATRGCLTLLAKSWSNKYTYQLLPGRHTIGAVDKTAVSDLMIKDNTMSARSARIDVSEVQGKVVTTLHIMDSLNPVYLNNQPLKVNDTCDVKPGDRLILGTTIIEFQEG